MASRRLLIAAAVAAPLVGFGAATTVLSGDGDGDRSEVATDDSTTTTSSPGTTTNEAPASTTTTTAAAPATTTTSVGSLGAGNGPQAPADAAGVARMVQEHDAALLSESTPARDLATHAHLLQVAYRALVNRPQQRAAVYDLIPAGDVRNRTISNVDAGAKLRSMITKPKDTLPDWNIVPPAPADELIGYYREAGEATGIPWQYLASIHLVETRMGRIRGTSSAGAQGPMQFMPATWNAYGEGDINSNRDAIRAAARYLQRNGAPGNMRNALWNYNHDYRYVDAVTLYAEVMRADERMYRGYHGWQVYYLTSQGDVWLPEGWSKSTS
jgi:hypothetical protein